MGDRRDGRNNHYDMPTACKQQGKASEACRVSGDALPPPASPALPNSEQEISQINKINDLGD